MHQSIRSILKSVAIIAAIAALDPYIEFLIAPPVEKAGQWAATLIALGVSNGLSLFLYQTRKSKSPEQSPED